MAAKNLKIVLRVTGSATRMDAQLSHKESTASGTPYDIYWGCSSVGRAPALQAGGHEFESHHLHDDNESCQTRKDCERRARTGDHKDFLFDRTTVRDEIARRAMNRMTNVRNCTLKTAH